MTDTAPASPADPLAEQFTYDSYVANVEAARLHRVHEHWRVPDPAMIEKKPQPMGKNAEKGKCIRQSRGGDAPDWQDHFCGGYHGLPAVHLDYMGHAAVTDALLQEDPFWNWEPVAFTEAGLPHVDRDGDGHARGLWMRLTVHGHTRLGYGTCPPGKGPDAIKELIGDGIRNAALRFGIGTSLWAKVAWDDLPATAAPAAPVTIRPPATGDDLEAVGSVEPPSAVEQEPGLLSAHMLDAQRQEEQRLIAEFSEPDAEPATPDEAPADSPQPPADPPPAPTPPAAPSTGPAPKETVDVVREMITALDSNGARAYAKYRRDKKLPPKPEDMTFDQAIELAEFLENLPKAS